MPRAPTRSADCSPSPGVSTKDTQVAALGYCLGGALAYQAAAHCGIDAAAGYYGVRIEDQLGLKDKITCPMVLHFGGADEHVPMEAVEKVYEVLRDRNLPRKAGC